ncbi:hypothetical protein E2P60_04760 [Candidatus Bathyarchaeota archaeon]|nr:hypothetical protein E2P60_04760 [Candidatus Bathyarchaeota archaeon]
MSSELLIELADKSLTKDDLRQRVKQDFSLVPVLLEGTHSPKAAVRYGCAKVLMDLSAEYPERLYAHMDSFIGLLASEYRILTWNALAIIANLAKVDEKEKLDAALEKYYSFLNSEYMVTVANTVGNSGKIALAKPYLIPRITSELLKVEKISVTPHLTEECKRVIAEKAIMTFDLFFDKLAEKEKKKVLSFVKRQLGSPRITLDTKAASFLEKWC